MFLDKDVFSTITNIADKGDFDLISFKSIFSPRGSNVFKNPLSDRLCKSQKNNLVLFQPELGLYPFTPGQTLERYHIIDSYIWNKCIKTKVYQKMVKKVGKERYTRYMLLEEDRTDVYALFNTAESLKYIGKYGHLHIKTQGSSTNSDHFPNEYALCKIYFVDICIHLARKTVESSKLLVHLIVNMMNTPQLKSIYNENEYNKKLIISCIKRILYNKYISDEDKKEIRKRALNLYFVNI